MQKGVPLHKTEWLLCHVCKNKTRIKLRQDTVLDHFPLYCPKFNGRADQFFLVFSVIETAKANGLDAKKYLTYLFDNRPDENMTDEQLEAFAPWNGDVRKACVNNVE